MGYRIELATESFIKDPAIPADQYDVYGRDGEYVCTWTIPVVDMTVEEGRRLAISLGLNKYTD